MVAIGVLANLVNKHNDLQHADGHGSSKVRRSSSTKFATPTVTSTIQRPLPRELKAEDIHVRVTDQFSRESKERGDDFLLAHKIAESLEDLIYSSTTFNCRKDTAKVVFDIQVTAASTGSRWSRSWKGEVGFVRLGLDFSVCDQTGPNDTILKHGKVAYISPLKESRFKQMRGRESGEKSLLSVLPVVSRQLVSELEIDTTYTSKVLA
ncbi:expressed unknown protein [Seminavis robusta]|uniref:Uncharacterized protein n=1 Tax=Seminavis robusta TaxID=568900 RepID=A0A9N8DQ18_9STRA|nr:expressed unknown protein [Seminavis robusta]|eukprot:Sro257_g100931.1  (208) ;mRNA; f:67154-67777